jgi:hypothetical protein
MIKGKSDESSKRIAVKAVVDVFSALEDPSDQFNSGGQGSTSSHKNSIGHYKAAMHHTKLVTLFYQRAMIFMITGYSPHRHRTGVDVMLLKKENNYHVDSL